MASNSFVHLHNHTEYSMLDGAARIEEMVLAAKNDGQAAIGITDHGNMYGVIEFYKTCRKYDITPIIGLEAYMAANSRYDRPPRRGKIDDTGGDVEGGEKLYHHLTLMAETTQGYKNLIKASSLAYLEGYYYKPRLDWELLETYHEGLIATTGCLGGVVLQALLRDDYKKAVELAGRLQSIFGRDSLFVELQDHNIPEQRRTNPMLLELAREIGAPLLATNDLHYVKHGDAEMHDALLCIGTGSLVADPNRFRFQSSEHYLKSADEMRYLFSDIPEACDNTLLIAERCNVEIEFDNDALPEFPIPPQFDRGDHKSSANHYVRELTYAGARERYGDALSDTIRDRLDYELRVITEMGFADYFLVVWDLIRFARDSKIRVGPGRGSAAGCCVAYCLRIVDLDPISNGLIFERFLNPGRKQMPDIDMDFDERFRGDMIRYASDRYGSDHVAQIVTFSTIKARAAVRDAARVLGYPPMLGDKIAKAMPALLMGKDVPLAACLEVTPEFANRFDDAAEVRVLYETDPEARRTIDVALGFDGKRRQDGIHAAAVVITKEPVIEYVPIQRKPTPNGSIDDAPIVTQFEMHAIEELGLLKMDFLGLRNLAIIDRAIDLITLRTGVVIDIDHVPLDDAKVFDMLSKGNSIGVFQLEGGPMRALMRKLKPTSFDDVGALVALYRPGPMGENVHNHFADRKNGRQEVSYDHDDLRDVLGSTYGLMIYQEDIMNVAQRIAGYSMTEADNLRKACGKKIREMIVAERSKFVDGAESTGYGRELGEALFDKIEPFADYAFNKSHAYGYALVAYQNAWLKTHYPVEYLAALLTSFRDDKDKTALYLSECRANGITVRVPDVNESYADFTPSATLADTINFGMAAVRNVGAALVEKIVAEREAKGAFVSVYDFVRRVDQSVLNRRSMESLIKAGAFDSFGVTRQGLLLAIGEIIDRTIERRNDLARGVSTLFSSLGNDGAGDDWDGTEPPIPTTEYSKTERLDFEREMLGLYISDHPLLGVEAALRRLTDGTISTARERAEEVGENGVSFSIGGVLSEVTFKSSRQGNMFARVIIEDLDGSLEVFLYGKTVEKFGTLLRKDAIVVMRGRLQMKGEEISFRALEVKQPRLVVSSEAEIHISLEARYLNPAGIKHLKDILSSYPGGTAVIVQSQADGKRFRLGPDYMVNTSQVIGILRAAFGETVITANPNEEGGEVS
ncbi:MAG: DNA polymerase III subunit alpha [Actinomycetota bacterium]